MKKIYSLWIAVFCVMVSAQAQYSGGSGTSLRKKGIGKITGVILEEEGGASVEFSTVSLFLKEKLVDGTITDEKGKFVLNELIDGNYTLEISFLGYEKKVIEDVVVEKERNVNLGEIVLSEGAATLDEVVVTGERSLIEEKVDRMVYNAEKDDLSRGGDAADVLRKVPLLSVDLEGNVSLRGSQSITVLINNKPSTIMAANVADALKMMPAEMIKTVEVITSPSAKYDAEGSGGIINIITKRNNLEGYYLSLNTAVGLRGSNLGVNGSLRKGKFGMTIGGFGRASYYDTENSMTQLTKTTNVRTNQFSDASDNGLFARYNLGFDYDIDKTQFLSGGVRYGVRSFGQDKLQTTELFNENDELQRSFLRDIESDRYSGTTDFNVDYLKIIEPGHEFSVSTLYSRTDQNSNFTSANLTPDETFINSIKNLDDNLNQELTLQTDYIRPIGKNQIVEVGCKGIFRQVNSDYSYEFADQPATFTPDFDRPSGNLNYGQNVAAAYTSYTISTPNKYTFKAGVRWEGTFIDALENDQVLDIPDYNNLVPSLNVAKTFKDFTTVKLGYNRRIQRPGLRQLNPNENVLNSQDIQIGNPNLAPELADNIELGISKLIKKTYLNVSFFGRSTNNAINRVRKPSDEFEGAIVTTFGNIGKERSLGTNVFANINFSKKWSLNGGVNLRYSKLEGQVTGLDGISVTESNSGWNYGGRISSQYKLNEDWTAQVFSIFRGPRIELQGNRGGWGVYAIGLNKNFKNKKGSFGIGFENFLTRGWRVRTELDAVLFTQTTDVLRINRSVRINFNYRFGKMDFQRNRKKTRSVRNDDVMGGDDGGMGGGMQGGGGRPSSSRGGSRPSSSRGKSSKKSGKKGAKGKATTNTSASKTPVKVIDFDGQWQGTAQTPMGAIEQTFNFTILGNELTGTITTSRGTRELENGTVDGNSFSFEVAFGQFTMVQEGEVIDKNKIVLRNDRGEMTLKRIEK
ncbi:MAG: TonB-dependent receptor [Bacteroidota bacterium]